MSFLDEMTKPAGQVTVAEQANRERAILREGYAAIESHPDWKDRYRSLVDKMESNKSAKEQRIAATTFHVMENQYQHLEGEKRRLGEATVMNALGPLAPYYGRRAD